MRKILTLALLLIAAACGDSTGVDNSFVGTYSLRSIDGDVVPITVYEDGTDYARVTGGLLILAADQTFTTSLDVSYSFGGVAQNESQWMGGTFKRAGNTFTLTDSDGDSFIATWDGSSTMTINDDGLIVVFRR